MSKPPSIVDWSELSAEARDSVLARPALAGSRDVQEVVRDIVGAVRKQGDAAVRQLTRKLDRVDVEDFCVGEDEYAAAERNISPEQSGAIDLAIANVSRFHEAQRTRNVTVETMDGVRCERVSHAIESVGLYVPAGTAPLPSTAIMLTVPAAIAGCSRKIMCTPPDTSGNANAAVLVAAQRAGIDQVFKIGGAQAIAAMAYGTDSVSPVDRIFGPGNAWVTEAKAQVSSDPAGAAIDMPAGPSEVLIIADRSASPEFIAADLLSQAEHGTDSQTLLVTTSRDLAAAVVRQLDLQIPTLSRADIAMVSMAASRLIVTGSLEEAVAISNRYAPEHLILHVDDPRALLDGIRNAGSIFLGQWSPESVGDYCSGTNHVLPTYGYARSYSGLSLDQFMRSMTIQELSPDGLRAIGGAVNTLALLEGLDAHAKAVQLRLAALEASQ
jgi:histidinol dehydrogenase